MRARGLWLFVGGVTLLKAAVALRYLRDVRIWEDAEAAVTLLKTGTLSYPSYGVVNHTGQFPMYAGLVALLYAVFGICPRAVIGLNLLLGLASAWVLYLLFQQAFDRLEMPQEWRRHRDAVIAMAVCAFALHPAISYYAVINLHPFPLDALMLYVTLLCVYRATGDAAGTRADVALGVSLGLALLTRTTLGVAVIPFFVMALRSAGLRAAARRSALVVAIALVIGTPWLVRNYETDHIVGYKSGAEEFLWRGALPTSDGGGTLTSGAPYQSVLTDTDLDELAHLDVRGQDHWFMKRYVDEVRADPLRTLCLYGRKLENFFWFRNGIGSDYESGARRWLPLYELMYSALLLGALLSLAWLGRSSLSLWSVIVSLGCLQSIFYVETRHRMIIEPLLAFLAAVPVPAAFERGRKWFRAGRGAAG